VSASLPTYARDAAAWREYQPHLPPALRLEGDDVPGEERWRWRGLDVHLDRFAAPEAPATVLVLHGGGGYGRILSSAGRLFREAGYEAVMPDLPGYGLTEADWRRCSYGDWVELVADLIAAERERSGRPVALCGMSVGGMLAWHAAAALPRGSVAAVIATNLLDTRDAGTRRAVSRVGLVGGSAPAAFKLLGGSLDRVRVPMPLIGKVSAIANDPALAKVFARDRLGGGNRATVRFLRTWLTYEPALEPEDWDRCPVLLAHPGDDHWTPTALSLKFFDRLPEPKRFVELENCGHLPMEEPGLTALRAEIADWLPSQFSAG
jgi:alpha-beta hydrolase superfamily lysophospholipase